MGDEPNTGLLFTSGNMACHQISHNLEAQDVDSNFPIVLKFDRRLGSNAPLCQMQGDTTF